MSQKERQSLRASVQTDRIDTAKRRRLGSRFSLIALAFILTGAILTQTHALFVAVESNNLTEVTRLVQGGADINSTDEFGFSLLVNALAEQELPIVDLLMQHGAEVFHNANRCKGQVQEDAETLDGRLLKAITHHDVDMVKVLLKEGAEVNACDDVGFSMLVNALALTENEMINFLVANGATMKTSI